MKTNLMIYLVFQRSYKSSIEDLIEVIIKKNFHFHFHFTSTKNKAISLALLKNFQAIHSTIYLCSRQIENYSESGYTGSGKNIHQVLYAEVTKAIF